MNPAASFDHLVGERQQGVGDRDTELSRGPEIDDQLHFRNLLHWQSAGFSPLRMRPV